MLIVELKWCAQIWFLLFSSKANTYRELVAWISVAFGLQWTVLKTSGIYLLSRKTRSSILQQFSWKNRLHLLMRLMCVRAVWSSLIWTDSVHLIIWVYQVWLSLRNLDLRIPYIWAWRFIAEYIRICVAERDCLNFRVLNFGLEFSIMRIEFQIFDLKPSISDLHTWHFNLEFLCLHFRVQSFKLESPYLVAITSTAKHRVASQYSQRISTKSKMQR